MEKTTYKQVLAQRQDSLIQKICLLTGLTQEQINEMIFEIGSEFIIKSCADIPTSDAFMQEPLYWGWWKQQWALVDESFWNRHKENIDRDNIRDFIARKYYECHNSLESLPDKLIFDKIQDTYMHLAQAIIKKHNSQITD